MKAWRAEAEVDDVEAIVGMIRVAVVRNAVAILSLLPSLVS